MANLTLPLPLYGDVLTQSTGPSLDGPLADDAVGVPPVIEPDV
jgi:hypothetical protein